MTTNKNYFNNLIRNRSCSRTNSATSILYSYYSQSPLAHSKFKVAPITRLRALSIVQGRAHYLLCGIATWAILLSRIIAVGKWLGQFGRHWH